MLRPAVLTLGSLLLPAPAPAQIPSQAGFRGSCFTFSYESLRSDADSTAFARMIRFSIVPGNDTLFSVGFSNDSIGFWDMFLYGATWASVGPDSLQLDFTNGFTSVVYDLGQHRDSLVGTARILFDFGNRDSMPITRAVGIPCR
jgi:hypothetical protein